VSTEQPAAPSTDTEVDLRAVPRSDRHPRVFAAYERLGVGDAVLLINDHEPKHLREEFDEELADAYDWDVLPGSSDADGWRIRIVKRAATPLPRIVGRTDAAPAAGDPALGGSVWRLRPAARDLDANVISLPPRDEIQRHDGPDLDVLIHVVDGSGTLETEVGAVALAAGDLVWLPRRASRRFVAGDEGLRYLSVHQRKPGLGITARPAG